MAMYALFLIANLYAFVGSFRLFTSGSDFRFVSTYLSLTHSGDSADQVSMTADKRDQLNSVEIESNPILDQAVSDFKIISRKYGLASTEAKSAWKRVEDIAVTDMPAAMERAIATRDDFMLSMLKAFEANQNLNKYDN